MPTTLRSDGVQFPNTTCQLTQSTAPGGMFQCFNTCLVCCGPHIAEAHCGRCGTFTAPTCASMITFEVWSGGGSGAGHCCQGCFCDMVSCGSFSGYYGKKTIRRIDGQFVPGCVYCFCVGAGGNGTTNSGCGCFTVCNTGPRGCASWIAGAGLCCFCMTGAQGGFNIYCTCRCNNQGNRVDGMCNNGLCIGCKWDFVDLGSESAFIKDVRAGCQCGSRLTTVSTSWGLNNGHTYHIEDSLVYCGCTNCCRGFRQIAMGGSNNVKSLCQGCLCFCNGTPGKPGLVRIEWS